MRVLHVEIPRYEPSHAERLCKLGMVGPCRIYDFAVEAKRIKEIRETKGTSK